MVYTLPFRPLKTFPDLGGRWGGNPQKSSPESEGDTSAGPAGPVPTTPLQEVPTTFLRRDAGPRRLPLPHPHRQGISQAAGSGKTGTRAPGRLHLALRAPRTRSGAALASRFGPAAKGPSSGGPALARPLLPKHLGSSHHPDPPSITGCNSQPRRPGPRSSPSVPHHTPLLRPPVPAAAAALAAAAGPGDGAGPPRFPHPAPRPGPPRPGPPRRGHTSGIGRGAPQAPPPDLPLARSFPRSRPVT